MIEPNHNKLTIVQQCKLLGISRSTYYYQPTGISEQYLKIMAIIDETYTMHPYYGMRRMAKYLQAQGFSVGRIAVRRYYQIMGLEAVYPKMNLSKRNQAHKIYPYLLKGLDIVLPNQVWSADVNRKDKQTWGSASWTASYKNMPAYFASQRRTFDPIKNTTDWPLFQQFRYGRDELKYEFPVENGEYLVELYFSEPWIGGGDLNNHSSERLMNISMG